MTDQKTYYVTTPIYYLSGTPHIGTAYTSVAADTLKRFKTLDDYKSYFLTGTDEHGLKVLQCAQNEGLPPQEYADKEISKFKDFTPLLNLSNDDFIRTTDKRHKRAAQALWKKLTEKGYIYKDTYSGWYAVSDEAYYDEDELRDDEDGNKVAISSGSKVEWMEEESYFFKLSAFQEPLLKFYEENPTAVLPKTRMNEVTSFIKSGLRDLSISRTTFDWGVPVPDDEKHVMYVWIDALVNYLSALGYPDKTPLMDDFWPCDTHLVGKDILRFHAVYWPAFLMAADIPVYKRVFAHGFIMAKGGMKMSKSLGNAILPSDLIERYGLDPMRYFLMAGIPFGKDGNYSDEIMVDRINSDLANNFGNLAQRTLSMVYKNCDGKIPDLSGYSSSDLCTQSIGAIKTARDAMDVCQINKYLEAAISLSSAANTFIDEQAPWTLKKTDPDAMAAVLGILAETIARIALMLQPIMPDSAAKILDQLNVPTNKRTFIHISDRETLLTQGQEIQKPEGVFPRLDYTKDEAA